MSQSICPFCWTSVACTAITHPPPLRKDIYALIPRTWGYVTLPGDGTQSQRALEGPRSWKRKGMDEMNCPLEAPEGEQFF